MTTLSPTPLFSIPSNIEAAEEEEDEGGSFDDCIDTLLEQQHRPVEPTSSYYQFLRKLGNSMHHQPQHHHAGNRGTHFPLTRRNTPTDSTLFSAATTASHAGEHPTSTSSSSNRTKNNRRSRTRLAITSRLSNLHSILKRTATTRKRSISETNLRRKVKKYAERSDWDAVRKLIHGYEFSEIPEAALFLPPPHSSNKKQQHLAAEGGTTTSLPMHQEEILLPHVPPPPPQSTASSGGSAGQQQQQPRRPSYGSLNGSRRSFTGGESAAASAAIKAALEESSDSNNNNLDSQHNVLLPSSRSSNNANNNNTHPYDFGENILHDVCSCHPPLDVVETLLGALRHRKGCTVSTNDESCNTPLHLAVMSGSSSQVIDALVRADPTPASMGNIDNCSPLHLAMKFLLDVRMGLPATAPKHHHHGRFEVKERVLSPMEAMEQTYQTVRILKDAMLTYPGKVDFKDEDISGYSPLDYAIEGDITNEALMQTLIRRREPNRRRRKNNLTSGCSTSVGGGSRSVHSYSSITETQDIDILQQLEQDEIESRRNRLKNMSMEKRRRKKQDRQKKQGVRPEDALFDMFGIQEQGEQSSGCSPIIGIDVVAPKPDEEEAPQADLTSAVPPHEEDTHSVSKARSMTDSAIYNKHMQDYLENLEGAFDHLEDHTENEGSFDIFQDPDLLADPQEVLDAHVGRNVTNVNDAKLLLDGDDANILPTEIVFFQDDDCVSVVSEVTVPVPVTRRVSSKSSLH